MIWNYESKYPIDNETIAQKLAEAEGDMTNPASGIKKCKYIEPPKNYVLEPETFHVDNVHLRKKRTV